MLLVLGVFKAEKPYTITDLENGGIAVTAKYNEEWKRVAVEKHGKWNVELKAWTFGPKQKLKVLPLLEGIDWSAEQPKRPFTWRPCGYPGCRPGLCDDCDGEGALYDYRGRRIN